MASSSLQHSNDNNNFDLLPCVDFEKTEIVASTKWIRLETLSYLVVPPPLLINSSDDDDNSNKIAQQQQPQPQVRKWDRVVRTTKHSETSVDAVVILATLRHSIAPANNNNHGGASQKKGDEIVCVKQYRPPVNGFTLELPAGLIDLEDGNTNSGDDRSDDKKNNKSNYDAVVTSAAMREFTEETGYIGTVAGMTTVGPPTFLSPGLTNECACLVKLNVDMTNEQNARVYNNYRKGIPHGSGMEESEREREMTTVLFPKVGLLDALEDYLQKNKDVKIFNGLHSLAVGMSMMEEEFHSLSSATKTATTTTANITPPPILPPTPPIINPPIVSTTTIVTVADFPLVQLQLDSNTLLPTESTSRAVTSALRTSGFLLIQSTTLLPLELQRRALHAARQYLTRGKASSNGVVMHPTDPKVYAMLQGIDSVRFDRDEEEEDVPSLSTANTATTETISRDLKEWYEAVRRTRSFLLHCIAVGLGMPPDDAQYFNNLHRENNDALRLIRYMPGDGSTGNRCKEHSDYGTLTLLLNDGVGGLEAHVKGGWKAVPHVEGSIVVNVGSLLSEWTRQELKATLHRVAGPASLDSGTERSVLMESVKVERISIAYFADPDGNVSVSLTKNNSNNINKGTSMKEDVDEGMKKMSVLEYIRWRSGGRGQDRSGIAFTSLEQSRLKMND